MNDPVSVRFADVRDVPMPFEDYEAHCLRAWELMAHWLGQSQEFSKFGLRMELDDDGVACPHTGRSGWVYSDKLDIVPIRINQQDMGMWPDTVEHRPDMFLAIHFAATALMDQIMGEIGRQLAKEALEAKKSDAEREFVEIVTPVAEAAGVTQSELQAVGEWLGRESQKVDARFRQSLGVKPRLNGVPCNLHENAPRG